jgi:hypothetical protein
MDAKVFRMTILMIISAFILVMVIVYATNVDKVTKLIGGDKDKGSTESSEEISSEKYADGEVFKGDQIGDNLSAFELDDKFFDPTERVPSVVVRKKNNLDGEEAVAAATASTEKEQKGTGMAVVGELTNPNPSVELEAGYYSTGNLVNPNATTSTSTDTPGSLMNPDAISSSETSGSMMNSGAVSSTDSSGYLTSLPSAPAEGYGEYIQPSQTITGTPVGIP